VDGTVTVRSVDTKGEAEETRKEMAQNRRVIQDCVYAPNPYHECTEACLQRIKETKPGKSTKNKKSSGQFFILLFPQLFSSTAVFWASI